MFNVALPRSVQVVFELAEFLFGDTSPARPVPLPRPDWDVTTVELTLEQLADIEAEDARAAAEPKAA